MIHGKKLKLFLWALIAGLLISCETVKVAKNPETIDVSVSVTGDILAERSPYFFGHNIYAYPEIWGDNINGTEKPVSQLGIRFLRCGGEIFDTEYLEPVNERRLKQFFDYCSSLNAEPLLQLPFISSASKKARNKRALEILEIACSMYPDLVYISLGNEPDLYASLTWQRYPNPDPDYYSAYNVEKYIEDYCSLAAAVKNRYPGLKIIGPDLSFNYFDKEDVPLLVETGAPRMKPYYPKLAEKGELSDWLSPFLRGCSQYIDMVGVHSYILPLSLLCSRKNGAGSYDQVTACLELTRRKIQENSNGKTLPLVITEVGLTSDGDPAHLRLGASPGTFGAALWMADFFGIISAQKDVFSVMPWSLHEHWKVSFLSYNSLKPRPVCYVYKLFTGHAGKYTILNEKHGDLRIYADKHEDGSVTIFVVNWDPDHRYRISFLLSCLQTDCTEEYTVEPWSFTCLTISPDSAKKMAYIYLGKDAKTGFIEYEW